MGEQPEMRRATIREAFPYSNAFFLPGGASHASIHGTLWHTKTSLPRLAEKFRSRTAFSRCRIIRSFPSSRGRHGPRHLGGERARVRRGGEKGLRRKKENRLVRGLRRREGAKKKFDTWLPDDTIDGIQGIAGRHQGPATTPVGGGIRSLNVALRQMLDLYVCLRPVRYFRACRRR